MPVSRFSAFATALAIFLAMQPVAAAAIADSPDKARFVTEDAERFWQVWVDNAGSPDADALQAGYLDVGTKGLKAFQRLRIGSAQDLADTIATHPRYYAGLRGIERQVAASRPEFEAAYRALETLYPPAVFPDTYFVIGRLSSAGTLADEGLLIGLDMHGRQAGADLSELSDWHRVVVARPEDLPRIVAHELVHYQHLNRQDSPSLLQQSVNEGVADFIGELIAGGHINAVAHRHGRENECALWQDFSPRMHGTDFSGFLYGGTDSSERPADLGYFIGYRIVQAYVARKGLSEATLRDALGGVDAATLLGESGYAPCD